MEIVTYFNGVEYKHSEYSTKAKRKNLPENVKKAILGDKYVEPIDVEPIVEEIV